MKRIFIFLTLSALIFVSCSNKPTITLKTKNLGDIYFEEQPEDELIVREKCGNLCIDYDLSWRYSCSEKDIKPLLEISGDTLYATDSTICSCDEGAYYELKYKIHNLPYGKYVLIYGFRNSKDMQENMKKYPDCKYFHATEIEFKRNMEPISIISMSDKCDDCIVDTTIVCVRVDSMPEFPNGSNAMCEYIDSHKMIMDTLTSNKRIIIHFVVERDGSLSNIEVVRSCGIEELDKDAVNVITNMPKWNPGKLQGIPVRATHTIRINYNAL